MFLPTAVNNKPRTVLPDTSRFSPPAKVKLSATFFPAKVEQTPPR